MKTLTLFVASLLVAGAARAEERATPEDAQELVKTAVSYLKKHGPEKAYPEFQNKKGPFIYKDLYVSVYDLTGRCVAHGADPARVGRDFSASKDATGKLFVMERVKVAKEKGSGWVEYKEINPADGKTESKTSYIERVGDVFISAGAYK